MDVPSSNFGAGFKLEGAMPVIPERKSVGEAWFTRHERDPATRDEVKPCAPSDASVAASPRGSLMANVASFCLSPIGGVSSVAALLEQERGHGV